jgi:hypothetical protein
MKTLELTSNQLRTQAQSYNLENNGSAINVYQYFEPAVSNPNYIIEIKSEMLEPSNYHILLNHRNIKLIFSEVQEINRPIYINHYNKQVFEKKSYERLRTFTVKLPNNSNFYIEQSHFDEEIKRVRITLKQHLN